MGGRGRETAGRLAGHRPGRHAHHRAQGEGGRGSDTAKATASSGTDPYTLKRNFTRIPSNINCLRRLGRLAAWARLSRQCRSSARIHIDTCARSRVFCTTAARSSRTESRSTASFSCKRRSHTVQRRELSRLSRCPGRGLVAACARGVHPCQQQRCAQPVRRLGSPLSPNATVLPSAPSARPLWCGECDQSTRMLGFHSDAPRRCPHCKPAARTQQDSRDPDGPHRLDRPLARQASPGFSAPGRREAQPGHRERRPGTTFGQKRSAQAGSDDPRSCSASGRTSSSPPPSRTTSPTRTGTADAACRQPWGPVASGTMI